MRPLAVLPLLLAFAVAACGGDEEAGDKTPTAPATASPDATASATTSHSPTPSLQPTRPAVPLPPELAAYRVIFARGVASGSYEGIGELWVSRMDGSDARRITREAESANLSGIAPHPRSREEGIYFVTLDGPTERTLWSVDLATLDRLKLFSFESRQAMADAAISPSGRYVAYAHLAGMDLIDLYTGTRRHLLDNGPADCDPGSCLLHSRPQWSPNEALLMVRRTFWEGGTNVILDPFVNPPQQFEFDPTAEPFTGRWADSGDAVCGFGRYATNSGLYIAAPPGWAFVNRIPEYEKYPPDLPLVDRNVSACAFLDGKRVAFTVDVSRYDSDPDPGPPPERSVELRVFGLTINTSASVAEYRGGVQISSSALFAVSGTDTVLLQLSVDEGVDSVNWGYTQPILVNLTTGDETPVLERGAPVVAVLAP